MVMMLPFEAGDERAAAFLETRDAITNFLFLKDAPGPVDLCFVLGCPTPTNMKPAISLYENGFTRHIMISGHGPQAQSPTESEIFRAYAIERGVPARAMILESAATNTRDNFVFSDPIVEERFGWENIARVALVAKPFHLRRAIMTARRYWPPHLSFVALPSDEPDDPPAETWWQTPAGRKYVLSELRAIGTYALQGDLGGF